MKRNCVDVLTEKHVSRKSTECNKLAWGRIIYQNNPSVWQQFPAHGEAQEGAKPQENCSELLIMTKVTKISQQRKSGRRTSSVKKVHKCPVKCMIVGVVAVIKGNTVEQERSKYSIT